MTTALCNTDTPDMERRVKPLQPPMGKTQAICAALDVLRLSMAFSMTGARKWTQQRLGQFVQLAVEACVHAGEPVSEVLLLNNNLGRVLSEYEEEILIDNTLAMSVCLSHVLDVFVDLHLGADIESVDLRDCMVQVVALSVNVALNQGYDLDKMLREARPD